MRAEGALLLVGLLGATAGSALGFSPECGMGSFGLHLRSSSQSCCSARSPAPASLQLAMKEEGAKGDEVFTGGEQLKIMMMRTRLEEENLEVAFASPSPGSQRPSRLPCHFRARPLDCADLPTRYIPFNPWGLTARDPGREIFDQIHAHCCSSLEMPTCCASSASAPRCCRQLDKAQLLVAAGEIFFCRHNTWHVESSISMHRTPFRAICCIIRCCACCQGFTPRCRGIG